MEFDSKIRRTDYFKRDHSILPEGPIVKSKWSHIHITFTGEDLNLKFSPHTDAIIIIENISGWEVMKILVDNGRLVDIIFTTPFDYMKIDRKLL